MKRQGETEANPRFKQLSAQLLAIQKAQSLRTAQQQQQHHHQQQQQQQQQQMQGRPADGQPPQQRPFELQASPVMTQRSQENQQPNGISILMSVLTL